MNSKNTGIWFVIAAALFAFIYVFERHSGAPESGAVKILPQLNLSDVTAVQIVPAGALEIRAERVDGRWNLVQPVNYPAQTAGIESLLGALQALTPAVPKISAAELASHKNSEAEFGFDVPRFSITVEAGARRWQLSVGNHTAPGDQVFLRVIGVDGAYVADAGWLKSIPDSAGEWRDTALVDSISACDRIVLTNNAKGIKIEFQRDPASRFWHMISPLPARADSTLIETALQKLQGARASSFVTDDPKVDLSAFGLQPPDLNLWLGHDSNFVAALDIGKGLTNDATQVYARREGWNTVLTAANDQFLTWRGSVNDFRDPYLLELTAPVAEVEMQEGTNDFTLQRHGSNDWSLVGEKFAADADSVKELVKTLAGLRVTDFVQDVVTLHDLPNYGLAPPAHEVTLRSAVGDTNAVIAQLLFGSTQTNEVFVKRADENFVYGIAPADLSNLFLFNAGWYYRDRRIWNFTANDVAQIILHQSGKTRKLVRTSENKWTLAVGSQGIITGTDLEEAMNELGGLTASGWVGRNVTDPEKYGLDTNNLSITVELKSGEKHSVDFGLEVPRLQTALAAVMLDGERWAFVFPPVTYQFVLSYLTIPANVP
jgi:hypothetical protein